MLIMVMLKDFLVICAQNLSSTKQILLHTQRQNILNVNGVTIELNQKMKISMNTSGMLIKRKLLKRRSMKTMKIMVSKKNCEKHTDVSIVVTILATESVPLKNSCAVSSFGVNSSRKSTCYTLIPSTGARAQELQKL